MQYSASDLPTPRLYTSKSVKLLSGATVWLVSGEGAKSPKIFYLGAAFRVNRVSAGLFDHPKFKNAAYGDGHIFGESIPLSGHIWFEAFQKDQKNFKNGLSEITDNSIITQFQSLSGYSF